jgi:hypothetical protein
LLWIQMAMSKDWDFQSLLEMQEKLRTQILGGLFLYLSSLTAGSWWSQL